MFTEANTVEYMIFDAAIHLGSGAENWQYMRSSQLPRKSHDVMVESWVREALIRLNPDIAAQPVLKEERDARSGLKVVQFKPVVMKMRHSRRSLPVCSGVGNATSFTSSRVGRWSVRRRRSAPRRFDGSELRSCWSPASGTREHPR